MKTLYIIPARGGSKGIPGKNIKPFLGKPLICHAIDQARGAGADDADICVSTDSDEIRRVVEEHGLKVPFMRPDELATDTAGTYEVLLHALDFYEKRGKHYDRIVLLQPTSPLRRTEDIRNALALWNDDIDMVVSVCEAATNPYYNAYETDAEGNLHISKGDGRYTRRQDAPKVWEYNGAVYVMSAAALREMHYSKFPKRRPYVMPAERSVDLDTPADWLRAEQMALSNN
ncbi:MAG: acylneuraminate cytidylyltransferase family protein [Muribaculaceae bacterium]|nr:acylneuraminate cytidylyltransferase family protein [Muribaculaceae bacterium]